MNEAIKLAIEKGGYERIILTDLYAGFYTEEEITQDPLFWQSLGRALGWEKAKGSMSYTLNEIAGIPAWQTYAHDYFDLVLTGGDTEKFWSELLDRKGI